MNMCYVYDKTTYKFRCGKICHTTKPSDENWDEKV